MIARKTVRGSADMSIKDMPAMKPLPPYYRTFILQEDYRVFLSSDFILTIPKGSTTDFASIPRFFWRIMPPQGEYSPAALVHDYLYRTGKVPRSEADKIFLDLMTELGVPKWKRNTMYYAVRTFGGSSYKS